MKFGRTYTMIVQGNTQKWTFGSPFTCRFATVANGGPTMNTGDFFIYNLPEKVRNDILADIYGGFENTPGELVPLGIVPLGQALRPVSFAAGYQNEPQLPVIFVGNVVWAYSYRQGPDWITQIHCVDGQGAIDIGNAEISFISGTTLGQIFRTICQALPGLSIGLISKTFDQYKDPRGVVVSGNPWEELVRRIIPVNAQLFVNKGSIYIILQNEYVPNPGGIMEINADTGIIGSPRRQDSQTIVSMIFEPRLELGQQVLLRSASPYAGETKLLHLRHYGTISESECGDLITEATFLRPDNATIEASVGVAA